MEDNMNDIVAAIEAKIGPLSLFLVLDADDVPTSMLTLVVSAVALDHVPSQSAVKLVIDCIKATATDEIQSSIGRVSIRPTSDRFVQVLTGFFNVERGPVVVQGGAFNEIIITHALIYKSARFDIKLAQPT